MLSPSKHGVGFFNGLLDREDMGSFNFVCVMCWDWDLRLSGASGG
jgi:hypothetical protein